MPDPLHTMVKCIDERINPKMLYERGGPALSRGLGLWLLTEQSKYGC